MNLILNAVDAVNTGGTLSITTSSDREFIEIAIADTGVGIPEEHWNKVFTPFFTTKSRGLGLGLVIVSQIIDNHYGSLRFDSVPDQGTAFHIRLPIHPARYAGNVHPGNAESIMEATS
jgi:signal transduction histidine kinase